MRTLTCDLCGKAWEETEENSSKVLTTISTKDKDYEICWDCYAEYTQMLSNWNARISEAAKEWIENQADPKQNTL